MPVTKPCFFMERPGFVSKNNIYQRPFVRHETSRVLNKIF